MTMKIIGGKEYPISREAYETVKRIVELNGHDAWLQDHSILADQWIYASLRWLPLHGEDAEPTGISLLFREQDGHVTVYLLTDHGVHWQGCARVPSIAELNDTLYTVWLTQDSDETLMHKMMCAPENQPMIAKCLAQGREQHAQEPE